MQVRFDVPKLTLQFACRIRDEAQKKGINNWSIVTVDPEGNDEGGGFDHFVMIRDMDNNQIHDFMINNEKEMIQMVDISSEVI